MVTIKVDKINNQIAWDAFVGSGLTSIVFLHVLFKKIVTSIKKNISKLKAIV